MIIEMENVMSGADRRWDKLRYDSINRSMFMESAISLVEAQLLKATKRVFIAGLTEIDKRDNGELINQLGNILSLEPNRQTEKVRTWFKRMRSFTGLVALN